METPAVSEVNPARLIFKDVTVPKIQGAVQLRRDCRALRGQRQSPEDGAVGDEAGEDCSEHHDGPEENHGLQARTSHL